MPLKTLLTWHWAQGALAWTPTSWKVVAVLWLKLVGFQAASENLWHVSQVVGKPAAVCDGFFEFWKSVLWQV